MFYTIVSIPRIEFLIFNLSALLSVTGGRTLFGTYDQFQALTSVRESPDGDSASARERQLQIDTHDK